MWQREMRAIEKLPVADQLTLRQEHLEDWAEGSAIYKEPKKWGRPILGPRFVTTSEVQNHVLLEFKYQQGRQTLNT